MPITITPLAISEPGFDQQRLLCLLTFSGVYPTGGDTLDFTTVAGAQVESRIFVPSDNVLGGQGEGTSGDQYGLVKGTLLSNNKIKINTASATELAAGAYPARISGDVNVYFDFVFPKGH